MHCATLHACMCKRSKREVFHGDGSGLPAALHSKRAASACARTDVCVYVQVCHAMQRSRAEQPLLRQA